MKLNSNFLLVIFLLSLFSIGYSYENKLNDYFKTIRCLVCEGQSINESDTEFAINLREQIKIKTNSGMSIKEINQELVEIMASKFHLTPPEIIFYFGLCL